jgi:hypothetical protein
VLGRYLLPATQEFSFFQFWSKRMSNQNDQQPKGTKRSRIGIGVAVGIALGVGLGAALHNIAIGVAIGVSIGAALGVAMDQQRKDKSE